MKKLFLLLIVSIPYLCFAQTDVQGEWRLSAVKLLRLKADHSFHLTKGAYHHYGNFETYSKSNTTILKLNFETITIDYEILSYSDSDMQLKDLRNDNIINAKRVSPPKIKSRDLVNSERDIEDSSVEENPYVKNHYRNLYPDNQYYFSLGGHGGASWVSGTSVASFNEEVGNLKEEFSISHAYSYGGSIKIGYQFADGFYLGSGGTYQYSGFVANRKASTADPEYQFDAESSQTAKFTYSSIEIPVWLNYRFADRWMVESGALASLPLRSTSKAVFNGENTVYVNGEIDPRTSYDTDEYSNDYPNLLENYAIGGYVEVQRRLAKNFIFSISYKYVQDFMEFNSAPISNNNIQANLVIQLF